METMDRWKINIDDSRLKEIYEEFLFKANELLTFYLSCFLFDEYTDLKKVDLDKKVSSK